jgi:hypothetical protein
MYIGCHFLHRFNQHTSGTLPFFLSRGFTVWRITVEAYERWQNGEEGVEETEVGARGYPRTSKSNQLECYFAEYLQRAICERPHF